MVKTMHESKKPITIALEGPDRVGKKTQSELLRNSLEKGGNKVELLEVPWNDGITYRAIYYMLEHGKASKYPTLFQVIQNSNKILCQLVKSFQFRKADYVIFDRWRLSSWVYGCSTYANMRIVRAMFNMLRRPDLTVVLVGNRLIKKEDDEYEKNSRLQTRVRRVYSRAELIEKNTVVIDINGKSREQVHEEIMTALDRSGVNCLDSGVY